MVAYYETSLERLQRKFYPRFVDQYQFLPINRIYWFNFAAFIELCKALKINNVTFKFVALASLFCIVQ